MNAGNPVSGLSKAQLKDIFTGKIENWKEVGGADMAINVYIVNKQSATRKVFQKAILGTVNYGGKSIKTIRPDAAILDKIGEDVAGIGQLSFAFGAGHGAADSVKKISVDGQAASVDNSAYPITRPLYLITKGAPSGPVKEFIDWTVSETGQGIVKKYFVGK